MKVIAIQYIAGQFLCITNTREAIPKDKIDGEVRVGVELAVNGKRYTVSGGAPEECKV